jgi:hypothetical protein
MIMDFASSASEYVCKNEPIRCQIKIKAQIEFDSKQGRFSV